MKFIFLILVLSACASATPQVDRLLRESRGLPRSAGIPEVPFIPQSSHFCGPATLAMAAKWAGSPVGLEQLAEQVYTPQSQGTFQIDMISAARRQGLIAIPVSGLRDLLTEINAGHPVIVFENLALSWLPQWHYALVFGYDLSREEVVMHSGPEAFKHWDIRKFERSWKLADYWGLVLLPADRLSATGSESEHTRAAVALEQLGKIKEAQMAYEAILGKWPTSLVPHIGLANIAYQRAEFSVAARLLKQAKIYHPDSLIVQKNLAVAERAITKKNKVPTY